MTTITHFIEGTLKRKVNHQKSHYDRPWNRKFLGFSFTRSKKNPKIRLAPQTIQRVKNKVRDLTSRKSPIPMEWRIQRITKYLKGWLGYFALIDSPSILKELDSWIRRRLRMCLWKQWKLPRTRIRKLIGLGVPKGKAYEWGNTRKGYWRVAHSPILDRTLDNKYWSNQGLSSLYLYDQQKRHT